MARKYSKKSGEEVEEAMHEFKRGELKSGKSGKTVKNPKQAIAIGLSKARRAGVKLPARGSAATRKKAEQDMEAAKHPHQVSAKRSRATEGALKREGQAAALHASLSRQTKKSAAGRSKTARRQAAKKAAATRQRRAA